MLLPRVHQDSHWSLLPPLVGRWMIYMPWNEFCMIWVLWQLPEWLTQPSQDGVWCCQKQTWSNKWFDFDWIYQVLLDSFLDWSRLRNFLDVETKTHWDWKISWMFRPRLIVTGKFDGCWDRNQLRLGERCWYWDSIETLTDICSILSHFTWQGLFRLSLYRESL